MQIKEKLLEIGKSLPHGAKKHISEQTGIRPNTIVELFRGNVNPSLDMMRKIMPVIEQIKQEQEELNKLLGIK